MENHPLNIPELLAPAGNLEKLKTAVHYGADAVYLGGSRYGLRARAGNFSDAELGEAIAYAHGRGVKVYVTVNIFAHDRDLAGLGEYLRLLRSCGADGIIVADPGVLATARRVVPDLPIHLSTQANVTNHASARFWEAQGVRRLNLARELSLTEIRAIRKTVAAEIELFVHGALCISYSGRCLLSLYLTGRDANQGDCAHPCRYRYAVTEEKRPGQYFPVEEDDHGTYVFNAKDLCLLHRLPDLIAAGADSIKIEGRMKSVYYVGAITRLYRAALDFLAANACRGPLPPEFAAELNKIGSRGQTENFLDGSPGPREMLYQGANVRQEFAPVGIVRETGASPLIEARAPLRPGDAIEYLAQGVTNRPCRIVALHDQEGMELIQANPNQRVRLVLDATFTCSENGLFRKRLPPSV